MNMTPKAIKLEVTRAIARDPGLSDAITLALGFRPRWSKLDLLGYLLVWLAYKSLTVGDPEQRYYSAYLAVKRLPEANREKLSLRDQAWLRVWNSPALQQYSSIIMYCWTEGDRHWQWVVSADEKDILDWAETIRAQELQYESEEGE